jgi:hypothetical protein
MIPDSFPQILLERPASRQSGKIRSSCAKKRIVGGSRLLLYYSY